MKYNSKSKSKSHAHVTVAVKVLRIPRFMFTEGESLVSPSLCAKFICSIKYSLRNKGRVFCGLN